MRESVSAACIKSYDKVMIMLRRALSLSPLECLSFANTIQADLPTCAYILLPLEILKSTNNFAHICVTAAQLTYLGTSNSEIENLQVEYQVHVNNLPFSQIHEWFFPKFYENVGV